MRATKNINDMKWYHKINLNGSITPGYAFDSIWDNIREIRKSVSYKNKKVLDIASWDGMWAFEAEQLGAQEILATDFTNLAIENFLFCKDVLKSKVIPMYDLPVEQLDHRLSDWISSHGKFDIIQNFGLLYHVPDMILGLEKCREIISDDGKLILETALIKRVDSKSYAEDDSYALMNLNRGGYRVYGDETTIWIPTFNCILDMLSLSNFKLLGDNYKIIDQYTCNNRKNVVGRICLLCEPISPLKKCYRS